ncbi:hypothetical protein CDD82_23 [Ophiocordyceps australis]|uniref:Uncharacterized protein n=1 Tax=Ophiocordyceps australis TaxID=1399860 RepID=A0A2C5ZUW8_9HYPO|nr:hypothetical protein CDD82_23 [Ophiocordyceps australis]
MCVRSKTLFAASPWPMHTIHVCKLTQHEQNGCCCSSRWVRQQQLLFRIWLRGRLRLLRLGAGADAWGAGAWEADEEPPAAMGGRDGQAKPPASRIDLVAGISEIREQRPAPLSSSHALT